MFISDFHLEAGRPFRYAKDLRAFVQREHISNFVVNGDLFNSPEDAIEILRDAGSNGLLERLGLNSLAVNFFWVVGSPAHDLANPEAVISGLDPIRVLGDCVSFAWSANKVLLYHGHDLSAKGALGHGWNRFISKMSLERAWKRFADVDKDTWVFFGHTHIPGVDSRHRVANSGGWQKVPFVKPSKTALLLLEGRSLPELVTIA